MSTCPRKSLRMTSVFPNQRIAMPKRTISLEVDYRTLSADARSDWADISERLRIVGNAYLTAWELHHESERSGEQIAAYLACLRDWHRADKKERGEKPKCPVTFDSSTLQKGFRQRVAPLAEQVHVHVRDSLMHTMRKTLTTSSEGLPIWMNALLHRTRLLRFTRGLPIPVGDGDATLEIRQGETADGRVTQELWLIARVDRVLRDGKRTTSTQTAVRLFASGKVARYAAPLWLLVKDGKPPKGVKLIYKPHKRKWFAVFAVDVPAEEKPSLDPGKAAIVYSSQRRPLLLRIDGKTRPITGAGYHVAMKRGQLQKQRRSRQANYRTSMTPNGKGHGRNRALEPWEGKFARAWRSFQKLNNNEWSRSIVDTAAAAGCGRIVYIQPTDGARFLDIAGQCEPNGTGWEWFQLGGMLRDKGAAIGVTVDVVKDSRERNRTKRFAVSDVTADAV